MNLQKAYEYDFKLWKIFLTLTFFPYQCALGLSIRWLQCTPGIRIYLGFIKISVTYLPGIK